MRVWHASRQFSGGCWAWGVEVGKAKPSFAVIEDSQRSQGLGSSTSWDCSVIILPFLHVKKSKTFINGPSGQRVITGAAGRIQAKSKRLDVLINGAALSPTHVQFPFIFARVDNNPGWGAQWRGQAWVLIPSLRLTGCGFGRASTSSFVKWRELFLHTWVKDW